MHVCKECPRERWVTEFLYGLRTVADEEQIREFGFKKWITIDQSTLIDVVQPVDEFVSTLGKRQQRICGTCGLFFQIFFFICHSVILGQQPVHPASTCSVQGQLSQKLLRDI